MKDREGEGRLRERENRETDMDREGDKEKVIRFFGQTDMYQVLREANEQECPSARDRVKTPNLVPCSSHVVFQLSTKKLVKTSIRS